MTIKRILLFTVCINVLCVFSQKFSIKISDRGEDSEFKKLFLCIAIFHLKGDTIASPINIVSSDSLDPVYYKKIIAPKNLNRNSQYGYGYIYCGSKTNDFCKGYIPIIVENPNLDFYGTKVWFDKNVNFDFTDDNSEIFLTINKPVNILLDSVENGYMSEISYFPRSIEFQELREINDAFYSNFKYNKYRIFMGTRSSMRERRLNVLIADWNNGADSFRIGVKDANCNGIYDELGKDEIIIGPYKGILNNLQKIVYGAKNNYLEWNRAGYSITKINSKTGFIDLLRDTVSPLKFSLNIGKKIPKFKYMVAKKGKKKERKNIRKFRGQLTYIYIWHELASGYYKDSAALHQLGRLNQENFSVVNLNYGSISKYMNNYNLFFKTMLNNGFSNNEINKKLMIKNFPMSILIDKRQRIVAIGITPKEMLLKLTSQ